MASVMAFQNSDSELATKYLEELYKTTKKELYLYQLTQILAQNGKTNEAMKLLEEKSKLEPDNLELKRTIVTLMLANYNIKEAKALAEEIAKKSSQASDYDLCASISIHLNDYTSALKELRESYAITPSEITLDRIATILYAHFDKKTEALALYETHIKLYGCSKFLCGRAAMAYEQTGKTNEAIGVYKKLYEKFHNQDVLRRIVELYLSQYKVDELIDFLQKTKADNEILLEAYKYKKDFVMASRTAMKIYKKTNDPKFLAQSAVYKFEANSKKTPAVIKDVVDKLTRALNSFSDDLFENYLGYLLIEYDIDIDKGVEYVKKALKKDPTSPFYLDSLAWGQYKQKKYKEAYESVRQAYEDAKDDPTVKQHYELIQKSVEKLK
jgi:tetratricopeptide (TPR) repeat protein